MGPVTEPENPHHTETDIVMRPTTLATVALLLPAALTACSVDDSEVGAAKSGTPRPSASVQVPLQPLDPALKAKLPKAYASRGTLVLALSEYSPYANYESDGSVTGLMPDLGRQFASMLGIQVKVEKVTFDATVPGIKSGRIDLTAPVGDFVERQKEVDLADFAQSYVTLMVNSSAGFRPKAGTDVCGHKVGVEKGAGTQNVVAGLSARCTGAGRPAVDEQVFGDLSSAALALQSKRIEAVAAPSASNTAVSESSGGRFTTIKIDDLMRLPAATATYGIASARGNGLAPVLVAALRKLYDTGTYKKLFDKWNLPLSTVDRSKIVLDGSTQSQTK
jgi:polar amino acid transport system substrate-binding protein